VCVCVCVCVCVTQHTALPLDVFPLHRHRRLPPTESCHAETTSHADSQQSMFCAISGFRHEANILTLLGCYAAQIGSWLPTFRDNLSVPFSRASSPRKKFSRVYFNEDHAVQALTDVCESLFGRTQGDIICGKERPFPISLHAFQTR
jgi:hypothetical protein